VNEKITPDGRLPRFLAEIVEGCEITKISNILQLTNYYVFVTSTRIETLIKLRDALAMQNY